MVDGVIVTDGTLMAREARDSAAAVTRMLADNRETFLKLAEVLRRRRPDVIVTCARGSSDHAATYAKYLFETKLGLPTVSAALSVASIYHSSSAAGSRLCLAISQSGRSPDLIAAVQQQSDAGALVVALVNDASSPLALMADFTIALAAGEERSVAATKSFIASLAAIAALTALWSQDNELFAAVGGLPDKLREAVLLDWSAGVDLLRGATNLFVLGRGYGLAVAQEAALKLKETCNLHAEAVSSAEVRHGPMAIVRAGFPILAFGGSDRAGQDVIEVAGDFAARGANVVIAGPNTVAPDLPVISGRAEVEPILTIQSFYMMANALALARGCNPDAPPFLNKVTKTQ